jgi:hypothetical protein
MWLVPKTLQLHPEDTAETCQERRCHCSVRAADWRHLLLQPGRCDTWIPPSIPTFTQLCLRYSFLTVIVITKYCYFIRKTGNTVEKFYSILYYVLPPFKFIRKTNLRMSSLMESSLIHLHMILFPLVNAKYWTVIDEVNEGQTKVIGLQMCVAYFVYKTVTYFASKN